MQELFLLLVEFIFVLLLFQIVFFELNLKSMKKANNILWYLSLDKKFNYSRTGYMVFICLVSYLMFGNLPLFSLDWFLYFALFLAVGIIADAIVQYLTLKYGQIRCKNDIAEAKYLQDEVLKLKDLEVYIDDYYKPERKIDEVSVLKRYVQPEHHLAFLTVDQGEFASSFDELPAVTYDVEPYGDIETIKEKLGDLPIKPTTLTQAQQMPFKDDKMDIVMNQLCNYDKSEIKRVLKPGGYFILHQNGTGNLKELINMYVPFRMKGEWVLNSCIPTLESVGFKILEEIEDYNYIQFKSIESLYSYFKKTSGDFSDVIKYKAFYMFALQEIKKKGSFTLSTYDFLVVAQNEM